MLQPEKLGLNQPTEYTTQYKKQKTESLPEHNLKVRLGMMIQK